MKAVVGDQWSVVSKTKAESAVQVLLATDD
jgi:hypothetical protein